VITRTKKAVAGVCCSVALAGGTLAPGAMAAQQTAGDSLVNVQVGDITVEDAVDVNVAAAVAATICGVEVGPVAVLATTVDLTGKKATICRTDAGPVTIRQNR
jgi:hypothetical protein